MAMHISGRNGTFDITGFGWCRLLKLAQDYGWVPRGTQPPSLWADSPPEQDEKWDGTYFSNDSQGVTAEDASNLADALERALPDLPELKTIDPHAQLTDEVTAQDYFSGPDGKEMLKDFITICRNGSFSIW